ncbi:PREDICTED: uncharacterized protein LOC106819222 [Priapulus caudatus]|uniref:Uncharacterized protein LOC106819222 n=1 Tax=Priapulus caudatus TaxID=37621 RepID=A0ABM1F4I5_PRICU|nr:PREDICTED: uncharacterized protein LOC106819222 [Priapulus caudatus]
MDADKDAAQASPMKCQSSDSIDSGNTFEHWSKYLRCDVCLDYFQEPVTLTCGHTFCRICIKKLSPLPTYAPYTPLGPPWAAQEEWTNAGEFGEAAERWRSTADQSDPLPQRQRSNTGTQSGQSQSEDGAVYQNSLNDIRLVARQAAASPRQNATVLTRTHIVNMETDELMSVTPHHLRNAWPSEPSPPAAASDAPSRPTLPMVGPRLRPPRRSQASGSQSLANGPIPHPDHSQMIGSDQPRPVRDGSSNEAEPPADSFSRPIEVRITNRNLPSTAAGANTDIEYEITDVTREGSASVSSISSSLSSNDDSHLDPEDWQSVESENHSENQQRISQQPDGRIGSTEAANDSHSSSMPPMADDDTPRDVVETTPLLSRQREESRSYVESIEQLGSTRRRILASSVASTDFMPDVVPPEFEAEVNEQIYNLIEGDARVGADQSTITDSEFDTSASRHGTQAAELTDERGTINEETTSAGMTATTTTTARTNYRGAAATLNLGVDTDVGVNRTSSPTSLLLAVTNAAATFVNNTRMTAESAAANQQHGHALTSADRMRSDTQNRHDETNASTGGAGNEISRVASSSLSRRSDVETDEELSITDADIAQTVEVSSDSARGSTIASDDAPVASPNVSNNNRHVIAGPLTAEEINDLRIRAQAALNEIAMRQIRSNADDRRTSQLPDALEGSWRPGAPPPTPLSTGAVNIRCPSCRVSVRVNAAAAMKNVSLANCVEGYKASRERHLTCRYNSMRIAENREIHNEQIIRSDVATVTQSRPLIGRDAAGAQTNVNDVEVRMSTVSTTHENIPNHDRSGNGGNAHSENVPTSARSRDFANSSSDSHLFDHSYAQPDLNGSEQALELMDMGEMHE